MPRPAILPVIDWSTVISKASSYNDWLAAGEIQENVAAMEARRKSVTVLPVDIDRLQNITARVYVLAFAEDWCGDVVRHVPVLEKLSDFVPSMTTHYLLREQAPEVFVRFLTNGGEAVPKFVFLSEALVECGSWGPMPQGCRELIARGKACGDVGAARKIVAERYEQDSAMREVIEELVQHLEIATTQP